MNTLPVVVAGAFLFGWGLWGYRHLSAGWDTVWAATTLAAFVAGHVLRGVLK